MHKVVTTTSSVQQFTLLMTRVGNSSNSDRFLVLIVEIQLIIVIDDPMEEFKFWSMFT
jgi:hypothetical protein